MLTHWIGGLDLIVEDYNKQNYLWDTWHILRPLLFFFPAQIPGCDLVTCGAPYSFYDPDSNVIQSLKISSHSLFSSFHSRTLKKIHHLISQHWLLHQHRFHLKDFDPL
uniref:Uncharacterized protein n=1 Tax=Helianthus annuus TaxID=4232 RepID=A0A251STM2_HELAN